MTHEEAIEQARRIAEAEHWPWEGPVRAVTFRRLWLGPRLWEVTTSSDSLGASVRVLLDDHTGEIKEKGFLPR